MKIKIGKTTCYFKGVEDGGEIQKKLESQTEWNNFAVGMKEVCKTVCSGIYYWQDKPSPCVVIDTKDKMYLIKSKSVCQFADVHDIFMIELKQEGQRTKYYCYEQGKVYNSEYEKSM